MLIITYCVRAILIVRYVHITEIDLTVSHTLEPRLIRNTGPRGVSCLQHYSTKNIKSVCLIKNEYAFIAFIKDNICAVPVILLVI